MEDVEEVTTFILDHLNFIKNWVVQQSQAPSEPDKLVSWSCQSFLVRLFAS